jgi:hypothetical protein
MHACFLTMPDAPWSSGPIHIFKLQIQFADIPYLD